MRTSHGVMQDCTDMTAVGQRRVGMGLKSMVNGLRTRRSNLRKYYANRSNNERNAKLNCIKRELCFQRLANNSLSSEQSIRKQPSVEDFLMHKILFISLLLFVSHAVHSEEAVNKPQNAESSSSGDTRQLVAMPDQARELMRRDMLDHLSAMNEIIGYLASNNLGAAADVAETRMGRSSMGKYRSTGMGPGRYMPLEMRNIGWGMHDAATEFSNVAKQGDLKGAYSAFQKVSGSCVACHYSFRTR